MSNKNNFETIKGIMSRLTEELNTEFFTGSNGVAYVSVRDGGKLKTLPIKSSLTRDFFHAFLRRNGFKVSRPLLDSLFDEFKSQVVINDEVRPIYIRAGLLDGKTVIDRGDRDCNLIVIDEDGFRTTQSASVHFVRPPKQRPLINPIATTPLEFAATFKSLCNFKNPYGWLLVEAALLIYLRRGPGAYPIIVLEGPQGSGKSSLSRMLRLLIDPCEPSLSQPPRSSDDIIVLSNSGYLLTFDNLSGINTEMADTFCRISTGGGISKRALYTDDEERTYQIHNPVILNGIDEPSANSDFVQRCLMIELNPLGSKSLKTETELRTEFENLYPKLLGGLYQTLSECIRILPEIDKVRISRMGDYSYMGIALEKVLGLPKGTFEDAYKASILDQSESAFDSNLMCTAIHSKFFPSGKESSSFNELSGTASELLEKLFKKRGFRFSSGPCSPKDFSEKLNRAEPLLNDHGYIIEKRRTGKRREIIVKLDPSKNQGFMAEPENSEECL